MNLTVKEVAELLNISDRAVRKNCDSGKYDCVYVNGRGGNGGKNILISLESLPQEAQNRYNGIEKEPELLIERYSLAQIKEAEYKASIVLDFQRSGVSAEKFIHDFNARNGENFTNKQLYKWQKKYKNGGIEALIDTRGGYNKDACSISEKAWDMFYTLYMTLQRRSIKWCYDKTKLAFPDIPSVSAFERKVKTIPEYAILKYHTGTKAFNDAMPHMIRDKSGVMSNDIWCSDHHRADVFVKNDTGHVIRPWITIFTDIRSTKVMSFIVREADPNTTVVKKCLRLGIEKHGVPNEIYTDNGKDYTAKKLSEEYPLSVMNVLGIGKITATPYHGQAKPVERFFRTLEERFGKMFYSYAGNDAKKRPEHMQKTNKVLDGDKNIPTLEFYIEQLAKYIDEYNNTAHHGDGMDGRTPNQVYDENLTEKREIGDSNALRLLFGKTVERTVQKNGIAMYNNTFTNNDGKLIPYYDRKVLVTYDPDDLETVYIFDMDYNYICSASAKLKTPFRSCNEEDYIRAGKEKCAVRQFAKKYKPQQCKSTFDLIAEYQLEELQYKEEQSPDVQVRKVATSYLEEIEKTLEESQQEKEDSKSVMEKIIFDYYKKNA
ncbi:MAG: Mu transposase C-terminal domain-containing protein [Ruminococcus sp.]|nr:Mu transposase C-terminal domain-containing protein [Ruminococcus sp.]